MLAVFTLSALNNDINAMLIWVGFPHAKRFLVDELSLNFDMYVSGWLSRKELKQTFLQKSDKITVKAEAARSFEWLPLLCLLSLYLILFQWCALFAMNGFFYFAKGPEWVLGKNIHPTRCRKVEEIFFTSSALRVDICQ